MAEGLDAALTERPRSGGPAKLDGKAEAVVIALACSPVPEGRVSWTAGMRANRLVELRVVESVSEDAILRALKKATSSRGRRSRGASRRGQAGGSSSGWKTFLRRTPSRTTQSGRSCASTGVARSCTGRSATRFRRLRAVPAKEDYEYTRHGTANLFVIVEPLAGTRRVTVTDRRTIPDFAAQMKCLCDESYPDAGVIRVVLDNLNTHAFGSLFSTYPPDEAWRLRRRLEFHYTPKHASWLNMAECELSVLSRQCLARRLASKDRLTAEVARGWPTGTRPRRRSTGPSGWPTPGGN